MVDMSSHYTDGSEGPAWTLSGRITEQSEARQFEIAPVPFRVGRRNGLSLMLPRPTISGLHAEFFLNGDSLYLRDLESSNGTFVNGQKISEPRELSPNDMVQFADVPFRVKRNSAENPSRTISKITASNDALAIMQFDRLLDKNGLLTYYQPIVNLQTRELFAFEALARSRLVGLETPSFMFHAAETLGATTNLSVLARKSAVEESAQFSEQPHLFLNTHPSELDVEPLLASCTELRRIAPHQPLTIEIHEAAVTSTQFIQELRQGLEQLNITIAFDDFGAGQARIAELAEVRPHYLKFDRRIIRDLHLANPSRLRVVEGLVSMVRDVGTIPLAEGIETTDEQKACCDTGFALAQGYLFGRPMPVTHYIARQQFPEPPIRA